jgi:hypothetical protein
LELIGESFTGRRNIGQAELAPLIEFPLDRELGLLDPDCEV